MPKNRTRLNQLNRKAATALVPYVGFILVVCSLVLQFTAWRQSELTQKEPFYTTLPGVDITHLPKAKAEAVLEKLNLQRCHCGCMRSVAGCRNRHHSCIESTVAAQAEVNAAVPQ
jgi:hypothetical protein